MKRRVLIIMLAAGLIAAAPATAGRQHWIGNIDSGGSVRFSIHTNSGHAVVRGFLFDGAQANCADGPQNFQNPGAPIGPMAVSDNTFHGTLALVPNGVIKVSGTLTHHRRKAHGTIMVSGDIRGTDYFHRDCNGKNPWHAARK